MKFIILIFASVFLPLSISYGQTKTDYVKAKNLARQAAERANGGLSKYRSVASMYDNRDISACQATDTQNYDAFFVCEVFGGTPDSRVEPTIRTIVELKITDGSWEIDVTSNENIAAQSNGNDSLAEDINGLTIEIENIVDALENYEKEKSIGTSHAHFPSMNKLRNNCYDLLDALDNAKNKNSTSTKLNNILAAAENLETTFRQASATELGDDRAFTRIENKTKIALGNYNSLTQ